MKKSGGKPETNPEEVIPPQEHTHDPDQGSGRGVTLGNLNQEEGRKTDDAGEKSAKERLENPKKDSREITIGPTTKTGPDITIDPQ